MNPLLDLSVDVKHYLDLYEERGMDVAAFRSRFVDLDRRIPKGERAKSGEWLQLELDLLALDDESMTGEPNDLPSIRRARPARRVDTYRRQIPKSVVADKVRGGVRGRIAGCVLGKPVECLMKEGDRAKNSRSKMKGILSARGEWPLRQY